MEFSKDNIVSKSFSKNWTGGLNEFEVRDFLHVLAEEIRHLSQKIALQKQEIQSQETLIKDYRDREHILKESIANAEKWSEKIRDDAEKSSHLVLEKAHNKSETLIQEARHSLQSVYNDIADLKRLQLQFKTGLKAALQVQMDLLDQENPFTASSSLSASKIDNFLEGKQEPLPEESLEASDPKKEDSSTDKEESSSEKPEMDEGELSSLRESLSAINKNFS